MARIYVVYTISRDRGSSVGRSTLLMPVTEPNAAPSLSWSDIQAIEREMLAAKRADDPSVRNLFLTFWQWLAPDPSPAPIHRSEDAT